MNFEPIRGLLGSLRSCSMEELLDGFSLWINWYASDLEIMLIGIDSPNQFQVSESLGISEIRDHATKDLRLDP